MALFVAACGVPGESAAPDTSFPRPETLSNPFPSCEGLPFLEAPAHLYREEPLYVSNEMPIDEVMEWAQGRDGFQDLWIDRNRNGWLTVAFIGDVTSHQQAMEDEFPGVGVVAVELPGPVSDLFDLHDRVRSALDGIGHGSSSIQPHQWMVGFMFGVLTEEILEALEPFVGEPLCIDGLPEEYLVADGPQPYQGDGWRLLGEDKVGEVYATGIATTQVQYERLWRRSMLSGSPPAVDFATEVVVWFGAVYSSSCDTRMDDLRVTNNVLHGLFVTPGNPVACTSDARPHSFVVAVERSILPIGPFAVQLHEWEPPPGAPEERTLVKVDLSAPGSVATDSEIGMDTELIDQSQRPPVYESGAYIHEGETWRYRLDASHGVACLGELNGLWWTTEEGPEIPEAWGSGSTAIEVEVELVIGPPSYIEATRGGHTVTYRPVPLGKDSLCS
jgi:hypothetical protein